MRNLRPTYALDKCTFFDDMDLLLTVHDWVFAIWYIQSDSRTPIWTSSNTSSMYTYGCFSPTRPGQVFMAKSNGDLEVWDFLDQSHTYYLQTKLSDKAITYLSFSRQHKEDDPL